MQRWCQTHKSWECECEGSKFNKTLMAAKLNGHLYNQVERVHKETIDSAHFVKQAKLEQARVARS